MPSISFLLPRSHAIFCAQASRRRNSKEPSSISTNEKDRPSALCIMGGSIFHWACAEISNNLPKGPYDLPPPYDPMNSAQSFNRAGLLLATLWTGPTAAGRSLGLPAHDTESITAEPVMLLPCHDEGLASPLFSAL